MPEALNDEALQYLLNKNIEVEKATEAQISDAVAYGECYKWYIENQEVMPNTADLASAIFIQKYALHDNKGLCLEKTPEDMWDRIANVLADEEVKTNLDTSKNKTYWFKQFRGILTNWKYTPQGSGLYSLGNPYVKASASNCFHKDTSVFTINDGTKKISDVVIGDSVVTHTGKVAKVSQIHKNLLGDRQLYKIKAYGSPEFKVTNNHKFFSLSKEQIKWKENIQWNSVDYLREGDYIAIPNKQESIDSYLSLSNLDISLFPKYSNMWFELSHNSDNTSTMTSYWTYLNGNSKIDNLSTGHKIINPITTVWKLDYDFMRFLGLWYGDGCVFSRKSLHGNKFPGGITFTFSKYEVELIDFVSSFGRNAFGLAPDININNNDTDNTTQIVFHNTLLGIAFSQFFGSGSAGKKLNPVFNMLSRDTIKGLLRGLIESDGCITDTEIRIVLKNRSLIVDLFNLFRINNILVRVSDVPSVITNFGTTEGCSRLAFSLDTEYLQFLEKKYADNRIEKRILLNTDTSFKPFKAHTICAEGYTLVQITKKEKIVDNIDYVYTLGIDNEDHSYTVEGVLCQNCFILSKISDNLDSIFDTAKNMAKIYAARGGCGINISNLRPSGSQTNNAAKSSTGAYSFCDFFSHVTAAIGQSGRRGALMCCLEVHHPDIFNFIQMKQDLDKQWFFNELSESGIDINDWKYSSIADRLKSTSHANVSVLVDNAFINAVENDLDYELYYDFEDNQYPRISKFVKAKDIWNKLIEGATNSAEPGIINFELVKKESPSDCYSNINAYTFFDPVLNVDKTVSYSFETVGFNPCAEVPASENDSCCLGTHNLPSFVISPYKDNAKFDYVEFGRVVKLSTRAQDNIKNIDIMLLPLEGLRDSAILGRRIGMGCTGLADALAMLGLRYDSEEAIEASRRIYGVLRDSVYASSIQLATEKGAFPAYDANKEKGHVFLSRLPEELQNKPRRNIACLTSAPNGSMSILMRNTSSGIEPVFETEEYTRNVKKPGTNDFVQFKVKHQAIEDCNNAGGDSSVFIKAGDINGNMRIKLQSIIQQYIDHAISSTINLPKGTTQETVSELYLKAFKSGCKGMTVYVDGSRSGVLNTIKEESKNKLHAIIERPKTTDVDIFKTRYKERSYMILVGKVGNMPVEVFGGEESGLSLPTKYKSATLTKKSRGHYTLNIQLSDDPEDVLKVNSISNLFPAGDVITITRMISMSLRNGIAVSEIVEQLAKSGSSLYDAPTVFARVLKNYISDEEFIAKEKAKNKPCPECGAELLYKRESGCLTEMCSSCNYSNSKCG